MNRPLIALAAALSLVAVTGCQRKDAATPAPTSAATTTATTFATPEAAIDALVAAVEGNDVAALKEILGPGIDELLSSGDEVEDRAEREAFIARYREQHMLVAGGPDRLVLQVGADHWPLPIPLVRGNDGWHLDGEAGADEIVVRRIGANELHTIDVMRGFVEAQEDYAAVAHDGGNTGVYAQKLRSDAGKQDGLYWEAGTGAAESPAGPALAAATSEGYNAAKGEPYHGYLYRILLSQGAAANGGAKDYVVDGKLTGGYALLGWPADYGASGIMTFIVNQDGVVWQRDLGEDTAKAVADITQFNPDEDWTPLAVEEVAAAN
ncbi:MAG TPA: DUF2950 domain-containing protein [Povalibacter sp.]|uniref:DUF2950 domain-containing protein n=1 Tax=Povalibacter sp. TaxID=1962978 RepID=UPI002B8A38D6|nr:DUF2950 domain-containing protein [Povalibacter sp.]HMN47251.1 DUF2950 domain-containing protein [Povalibacter sp.]